MDRTALVHAHRSVFSHMNNIYDFIDLDHRHAVLGVIQQKLSKGKVGQFSSEILVFMGGRLFSRGTGWNHKRCLLNSRG